MILSQQSVVLEGRGGSGGVDCDSFTGIEVWRGGGGGGSNVILSARLVNV